MPHIMLTETESIAAECIEEVRIIERNGTQGVELWHKRTDLAPSYFWGEQAKEVWKNWRDYVVRTDQEYTSRKLGATVR